MSLPSLRALQAFEAAGRLGSFQRAAREVGVTPGAVTKQMQSLEDMLGSRLFVRLHRSVELTPAGHAYLAEIRTALSRIETATQTVSGIRSSEPLRVYCPSLFMRNWLTPRLARFLPHAAPDLDIVLNVGTPRVPLPPNADIGIRLGMKQAKGLTSHRLFNIDLLPVCSPAYLAAFGKPATVDALRSHTLLGSLIRADMWQVWLKAAGADLPLPRMISFPDGSGAYQAALEDAGIAIANLDFASPDLASGRLVKTFEFSVRYEEAYYLVYPKANARVEKVRIFRDWLLDEVRLARTERQQPAADAD